MGLGDYEKMGLGDYEVQEYFREGNSGKSLSLNRESEKSTGKIPNSWLNL